MCMTEVFLFALGVGAGYGLSTLSIYMGSKLTDNVVQNFTAPIMTQEEPILDTEMNPFYDFQAYEDTLKDYINNTIEEQENTEPDDEDFQELN